jgi:hypothetical protein
MCCIVSTNFDRKCSHSDKNSLDEFSESTHTSYSTSSLWRWNWQRVPKRRQTTIWRRGNTQKNIYNIQNTAKVWNQEYLEDCCRNFWVPHCTFIYSFHLYMFDLFVVCYTISVIWSSYLVSANTVNPLKVTFPFSPTSLVRKLWNKKLLRATWRNSGSEFVISLWDIHCVLLEFVTAVLSSLHADNPKVTRESASVSRAGGLHFPAVSKQALKYFYLDSCLTNWISSEYYDKNMPGITLAVERRGLSGWNPASCLTYSCFSAFRNRRTLGHWWRGTGQLDPRMCLDVTWPV